MIWKGINLKELGIIIEKTPKISKANKKINIYEIDGRNGFLSEDTGTYEAFSLSVECHIRDTANIDEICEYLDGYGTLSLDGNRQYTAIINNTIPFEKVLMFKKFVIQFLVNPICEDIVSIIYNVKSNNSTLSINNTYYDIEPTITLTCSGDVSITINNSKENKTFYLDNASGTYVLDCKNKVIVKDNVNSSNIMQGDFPKLVKGNNSISYTGTITQFKIEYKKTYLWGGQ